MKVTLLRYTDEALLLLLDTKNTRLGGKRPASEWTHEERMEHLEYMRNTIQSSWEFVDYTFRIEGVTRAFTHQLVRTRTGSYAQEAQRVVDVSGHDVLLPFDLDPQTEQAAFFSIAADYALSAYDTLVKEGMNRQDARGILPTNISTSITAKFNLRTLSDTAKVRLCTRTQGEYQTVFRAMREEVVKVHPWAAEFINVKCVSDGICAFPNYGKESCKFYKPELDQTEVKKLIASEFWAAPVSDSQPVLFDAANGRTK